MRLTFIPVSVGLEPWETWSRVIVMPISSKHPMAPTKPTAFTLFSGTNMIIEFYGNTENFPVPLTFICVTH